MKSACIFMVSSASKQTASFDQLSAEIHGSSDIDPHITTRQLVKDFACLHIADIVFEASIQYARINPASSS